MEEKAALQSVYLNQRLSPYLDEVKLFEENALYFCLFSVI